MHISICQINPIVGDLKGNTKKIIDYIKEAKKKKADIIVFQEMAISGYPAADLLLFSSYINEMERCLQKIVDQTKNVLVIIGVVRKNEGEGKPLFNSSAVINNGKIIGYKDKTLLPNYGVFNEVRYFEKGTEQKVWTYKNKKIGVLICEDVWNLHKDLSFYKTSPIKDLKKLNPDIIIHLAASPYYFEKHNHRFDVYQNVAKFFSCPFVSCNQVGGNDQLVFDGKSLALDKKGDIIAMAKSFKEDLLCIDLGEKIYKKIIAKNDCFKDFYDALVVGVRDYFNKLGLKKACLGISGGVDSALTACIAKEALGEENILGINMPSRFSSISSIKDSYSLCKNLNIQLKDIPIDGIFQNYLNLLSPIFQSFKVDTTEENLQARIRGMILMAISNKLGYVVLSSGNKSEMAMGYSTLYGDLCGGLSVIGDVSKTFVYKLVKYINKKKQVIPNSIIKKAPSAELRENQKDSDDLPDYEIVDTVLTEYIENACSANEIVKNKKLDKYIVKDLLNKIHKAEFKRRQSPISICVTKKSFSKGCYLPIVQKWD